MAACVGKAHFAMIAFRTSPLVGAQRKLVDVGLEEDARLWQQSHIRVRQTNDHYLSPRRCISPGHYYWRKRSNEANEAEVSELRVAPSSDPKLGSAVLRSSLIAHQY
eukprot:4273580-Pleurochrysis_carterae.AAC.1